MALPLFPAPSTAPGGHPHPSPMAHSSHPAPSSTSRPPPLQTINTSSSNNSRYAIRVKLPIPARTKARQPTSANPQSPSLLAAQGRAVDQFFGQPSSRRDKRPRRESRSIFANNSEPETVAKYLFWYGFGTHTPTSHHRPSELITCLVFPPFWVIGTFILFIPLRAPDPQSGAEAGVMSSTISSTNTSRRTRTSSILGSRELALMRITERRWGRRCVYAWVLFMLAVAGVIVALRIARLGVFSDRS